MAARFQSVEAWPLAGTRTRPARLSPAIVVLAIALALSVSVAANALVGAHAAHAALQAPAAAEAAEAAAAAPTRIAGARLDVAKRKIYTGKAVKPAVTVRLGKKTLVPGTDYTVSYRNNVKAGTATATVTGKNLYAGRKAVKFKIVKKPLVAVPEFDKSRAQGVINYLARCGIEGKWVKSASVAVAGFDGLALPGGYNDIHPSYYGEKNKHCRNPKKKLDQLQFKVLRKFAGAGKPVMGICRGVQVINVAYGGSLVQDVGGYHRGTYTMKVKKGSWLGKLGASMSTYHFHHQAPKRIAKGFVATGWCNVRGKKVVEAIEHETLPIYGFQFHPEVMGKTGTKIGKAFARECRKRM